MKYLNCKVFYITFTLNKVFPDLLEQTILLCTEIMTCLIFKCPLLAVVAKDLDNKENTRKYFVFPRFSVFIFVGGH